MTSKVKSTISERELHVTVYQVYPIHILPHCTKPTHPLKLLQAKLENLICSYMFMWINVLSKNYTCDGAMSFKSVLTHT